MVPYFNRDFRWKKSRNANKKASVERMKGHGNAIEQKL